MKTTSQTGAALILALMLLSFLAVLGGALLTSATLDIWIGDNYKTHTQALYLAEGGIAHGRDFLRQFGMPAPGGPPLVSGSGAGGTYQVWLRSVDANGVATLVSTAVAANARRTFEVKVRKGAFPDLPAGLATNASAVDSRLKSVRGLEKFVASISANAADVFAPTIIGNYGSPTQYSVAVVNGDCTLGPGTGYGLLLVRGNLKMLGNFVWNGLIVVIGQGTLHWNADAYGQVIGGIFVARTRDVSGAQLATPGATTVDMIGAGGPGIQYDPAAMTKANESFPYTAIAVREY